VQGDIDSYYCGKNVWYNICDSEDQDDCPQREHAYSGAGHAMNGRLQTFKVKNEWQDVDTPLPQIEDFKSVLMGPYKS